MKCKDTNQRQTLRLGGNIRTPRIATTSGRIHRKSRGGHLPSARYGAEGTAGIMNIILKKQELLGFNGNIVANAGQTHSNIIPSNYGGSANINLRKNKFNIFSTNSYSKSLSIGKVFNENEYFNGNKPSTFLEESRKPERENFSFFSSIGIEYYFKEKTSLILSGFVRDRSGDDYSKNILKRFDAKEN